MREKDKKTKEKREEVKNEFFIERDFRDINFLVILFYFSFLKRFESTNQYQSKSIESVSVSIRHTFSFFLLIDRRDNVIFPDEKKRKKRKKRER